MKRVFIDGSAGTTGLRIRERLAARDDIELLILPEEERKDIKRREEALNTCDIAFLCLPDDAAREAVSLVTNKDVVILDTSTAHRTDPNWAYGFPELSKGQFERIKTAKRIAVPGCHASGFIALIYPLVADGLISPDTDLVCHSVTGYSGGGKKMIAEYQAQERSVLLDAPRQYGIGQRHKHLPEMVAMTGLSAAPIFCPIVADFYSGMEVTVGIFGEYLREGASMCSVKNAYEKRYTGPIVSYAEDGDESGFLAANKLAGKDTMQISVYGTDERMILTARYDNLGKGASGAAVECMNIVLGLDPATGLEV